MAEPFLGEIRLCSFAFAPKGWALCNGQLLPINSNQALFSLLGTQYGGDGRTNFALPDLRGAVPMHAGSGLGASFVVGQKGGESAHSLTVQELPAHSHGLQASADFANTGSPAGAVPAARTRGGIEIYATPGAPTPLHPAAIGTAGAGQAHENMQPYLTLNFVISLQGIFPSRN